MKNIIILIAILMLFSKILLATNPEWIVFTKDSIPDNRRNSFSCIFVDSMNNKWTSAGGICFFDNHKWYNTNTVTYHDSIRADLAGIYDIEFNSRGNIWMTSPIGTIKLIPGIDTILVDLFTFGQIVNIKSDGNYLWFSSLDSGIIRYNDTNWTVFNRTNGLFPTNRVTSFKIDTGGLFWLATDSGLVSWDKNNYTIWNDSSFLTRTNDYYTISIDKKNNKWLTFPQIENLTCKFAKFEGVNWTIFDSTSFNLLSNDGEDARATGIAFDSSGNKWISTFKGLVKYNDTTFTLFNTENSGLPHNWCHEVAVDKYDNIWIATYEGLAVYNPHGVQFSLIKTKKEDLPLFLSQSKFYPNPAAKNVTVNFQVEQLGNVTCDLYGLQGRFISRVINKILIPGDYNETIDTSKLPNGTYLLRMRIGNKVETKQIILAK